ncbi:MAG: hypothetical protein KF681_02375 [Bdellovibrionaceae bacterium]|nr:hypothetical protein [Pseudobdellovibrionaceae bacterium]
MKITSRQVGIRAALAAFAIGAVLSFQNCSGGFKTAPLADQASGTNILASTGTTPTPTPNPIDGAQSSFLAAFGALQNAITNGITGAQLQTLINQCNVAKALAVSYGLDVSGFPCEPVIPEVTPAQAQALLNTAYAALQAAINAHLTPAQIQIAVDACNQAKAAALVLGVTAASSVNCSASGAVDPAVITQAGDAMAAAYAALQTAINFGISGGALAGLRSACESAKTIAAGYGINVSAFNCQM